LESFRLDEYKQMDDGGQGIARLVRYFQASASHHGAKCVRVSEKIFQVQWNGETPFRITSDRDMAIDDENLSLLGLEHPIAKRLLDQDKAVPANGRALTASMAGGVQGVLSIWHVTLQDSNQRYEQKIIPIGIDVERNRCSTIESYFWLITNLAHPQSGSSLLSAADRQELVINVTPDMLRRDLTHKGLLSESITLDRRLLFWIELV
jgi:hypothetical protein